MKTTVQKLALGIAAIFGLFSCDEKHEGELINDKEAKINAFQANGIDGIIDEQKQTITIYAPWSASLNSMTTSLSLPEGATSVPKAAANVDLSSGAKYRIFNGNLYWDYTVTAQYPKIENFAIGKYKATIDHSTGKISVKYPKGESLTALTPTFSTTPNATVSPASGAAQNFTQSVTYTMNYRGESFTYNVEIIPTNFAAIAFVGTANSASAIANEDEKAAYAWLVENYDTAKYISFTDIKDGKVNLNNYKVIWWHYDVVGTHDMPADATNDVVVNKMKQYYANGGSFLFTSWAGQYATTLGMVLSGKMVNNMWNEGKNPESVGDDWGISFRGNESHPLFKGLNKIRGRTDAAYLLSKEAKRRDHNTIWNLKDFGDYKDNVPLWKTETGAELLASYHWDNEMKRATIYEFPKRGNTGRTLCIGIGSYDWYNEDNSPANTYKSNIELLTANALEYLAN